MTNSVILYSPNVVYLTDATAPVSGVVFSFNQVATEFGIVSLIDGVLVASQTTSQHYGKIVGIVVASSADSCTVVTQGFVENPSWNWNLSSSIYLGPNGSMTQTEPQTDLIQQLALPITATKIFFGPQSATLSL
jgi:hypothetical protein